MQYRFADRVARAPESFLDELFRVSADPSIISFAGGLPSSALIDTEGIARAAREVMEEEPQVALQYTTTDGYLPLREYIADRYRRRLGIPAVAEEIQIVNGSQQCLDLFAKLFLNTGDHVGMERPGYLGAIEAFSLYEPVIDTVPLEEDGPALDAFERLVKKSTGEILLRHPQLPEPFGQDVFAGKAEGDRGDPRRERHGLLRGRCVRRALLRCPAPAAGKTVGPRPGRDLRLVLQDRGAGDADRVDVRTAGDPQKVQHREAGGRPPLQLPLPEDPAPVPHHPRSSMRTSGRSWPNTAGNAG